MTVSKRGPVDSLRRYVRFTRPFTLLPPLLGVVSGAVTAWGSASNPHVLAGQPRTWTLAIVATIVLGSACAALLNAGSNVINQYYDFENDRINKPSRPLITGEISMRSGFWYAIALYVAAVVPTWLVVTWPSATFADTRDLRRPGPVLDGGACHGPANPVVSTSRSMPTPSTVGARCGPCQASGGRCR